MPAPSLPRAPSSISVRRRPGAPAPLLSIGFILADRFTLCAFANFVDVLRLAADEADRSRPIRCRWSVLSEAMRPARSSCGVAIQPDEPLGDPSRFDYVVVVGGLIGEVEPLPGAVTAFLHRAAAARVPLVGLCTGAFALERAGLMDGYKCCVSWFHREDFLAEFAGLEPISDQLFVVDRDRITSSGGVSSAHVAAYLVQRHVGRAAARKSLNIMLIDDALAGEMPQPGVPIGLVTDDELVRRALVLMREAMEAPLKVSRLAARLGVGRRTLERRFAASLGMSPHKAARALRIAKVKRLLSAPERSITTIAADTGFCDVSHLVRAFRAVEGTTPEAWRRTHTEGESVG